MLNEKIRNIPIPARMARLPVNDRGFPVPWFVAKVNGEWDFRAVEPEKVVLACRKRLCWLCGEPLGQFLCFVIGPMCSVNRVSAEPPSHLECARYAVRACPFLTQPRMRRNTKDLFEHNEAPGVMLEHNPGACAIWITKSFHPVRSGGGYIFRIGEPHAVEWYTEGRPATRDDILSAFQKGLPLLQQLATKEGHEAVALMDDMLVTALKLIPA